MKIVSTIAENGLIVDVSNIDYATTPEERYVFPTPEDAGKFITERLVAQLAAKKEAK